MTAADIANLSERTYVGLPEDGRPGDHVLAAATARAPGAHRCRSCAGAVDLFVDQGDQPVANGFRRPDEAPPAAFRIRYGVCTICHLVQLLEPPPAEALFHADYAFLAGASAGMARYYALFARELITRWNPKSVLEIGCNDGTLLQHFAHLAHLGVDPSANVAALARAKGLTVWARPWNAETACLVASTSAGGLGADDGRIQRTVGRNVDLVVAAHVLTHVVDLDSFLTGVDVVLAPDGVLVLEDPSLDAIVQSGDFDQLYDEHAYVLSLPALEAVLARHGFEVIGAEPQHVHGGSLRVTAARAGAHKPLKTVRARLQEERYLTHPYTYRLFADAAARKCAHLRELLLTLKASGKRLAAYGASSKLTLVLNRCGVGGDVLDYVSDTTPTKQGKVLPVLGQPPIPVISREAAAERLPDYFLLGAWVHLREVMGKEAAFLEGGGKFVVWNPTVKALGAGDAR